MSMTMFTTSAKILPKVFAVSALSLAVYSQAFAAVEAPDVFVKKVADSLVNKLTTQRAAYKKNPALLNTIVQQNIEPYVDFDGFSRGVMGKYYREATDVQRTQFATSFKTGLMRTYANSLAAYDNESYTVRPYVAGDKSDKAVVTMDFKTDDGKTIPVTYQMVQMANTWKIRNVQLNGIDVGLTFRNQFVSTVQKNKGDLDLAIKTFVPTATTDGK